MDLQKYVANTAKKMIQVDCGNGNSVGVFKDEKEQVPFYAVTFMRKEEKQPKFKFFINFDDAMEYFKTVYEIID